MKFLTAFLLLSVSAAIPAIEVDQPNNSDPFVLYLVNQQSHKSMVHPKLLSMRLEFLEWGKKFGKVYKSMKEEMERMLIWIENHEFIENHNNQVPKPSYTVGHNHFSDLTNDEFQKLHSIGKYSPGVEVIREGRKKALEKSAMRKIQNGLRVDEDYPEQVEFRYLRNLAASGGEDSLDMEGDWLFTDDLWDMDLEDIKQKGDKLAKESLFDDGYYSADDGYYSADDDDSVKPSSADDDSVEPSSDDNSSDDNDTKGLPDEIDWVTAGAVTPVKNQQSCGSCWAFSTTGAIEGASFVKYGELINLSEQNLIDCDKTDHGCAGGMMEEAFKYDESAHGLCSESQYPYIGVQGHCNSTCTKVPTSVVADYLDIDEGDKHGLLASLVLQPTSIAMQADQLGFQFYTSGVFSEESCGREGAVDHGVLAVGYGTDEVSGKKYFKVKNSWGEDWGESGYFRLDRESKNQWGTCAILMIMTAPIMA